MLLLTAWEMVQGVVERLRENITPEITPLVLIVLVITLMINIGVSRYQIQAGTRLNSEVLLADARNTRADIFVTLSVIVSSIMVALTGFAWIDIASALIVIVLIGKAAWEILTQTGQVLVDTAPLCARRTNSPSDGCAANYPNQPRPMPGVTRCSTY